MKLTSAAPLAVFGILAVVAGPAFALPAAEPGSTVNDYTATQSQRAEAVAHKAGFDKLDIAMVQDGNFFLNGQAHGQDYSLTVTRDGKVYPSTGLQASSSS